MATEGTGGGIYIRRMHVHADFCSRNIEVASEALGITKLMLRLLEGHLTSIIPNAFTKECFFVTIQAEGKTPSKTTGAQIWMYYALLQSGQ